MGNKSACAVCGFAATTLFTVVDGYDFYCCGECDCIYVDPRVIHKIDAGQLTLGDQYGEQYWEQEELGARERAGGVALVRAGEALLYCRRPVERFLDVGAGPGFLLSQLQELIDPQASVFHGVEKYPPRYACAAQNFHLGGVESLQDAEPFDAGICIEVIEHLTPHMLDGLVEGLARVSKPDSFWLFNTGMPDYVRQQDPAYLDPMHRGHIVSYALPGLVRIFGRHGFRVGALPGKNFAFYAEFEPTANATIERRIHSPEPHNVALLRRHELLWQATFEAARSYFYYEGYVERTRWALDLQGQLDARK